MMCQDIDRINQDTMRKSVGNYSHDALLTPAEQSALNYIRQHRPVTDKPILDLGVGGGRTVAALRAMSTKYVGIDYIADMVAECQRKFPEVHFEQGDARDLSRFKNDSFALVMFSLNGISMVNHHDRLNILKEVYRVLEPGGSFLFSTYNQDNKAYRKLLQLPEFSLSLNPLRFGVRSARYLKALAQSIVNRYRYKKLEIHCDEYSLVNDKCHNYATMLYYITQANQYRQLRDANFDPDILAFDLSGSRLHGNTLDDSIFYLAQKGSSPKLPAN